MCLSIASVVGLAIAPALAGCPYARDLGLKANEKETPYAHLPRGTVPTKSSVASLSSATPSASADKKGLFLMNHIAPGTSKLYIANANGTNELSLLSDSVYEYHADFSPDGEWITFTSERNGDRN